MRTTIVYVALMVFTLSIGITMDFAHAVPVKVSFDDSIKCDKLYLPNEVDELGRGGLVGPGGTGYPFPLDETIRVAAETTYRSVCKDTDDPDVRNALVHITNITSPKRAFKALWYVGNPNTYLSNVDGVVLQQGYESLGTGLAFRIDDIGKNTPLISESLGPANGIFEHGETWKFIIQDFSTGTGPSADEISSIGVAGGSLAGGATIAHLSSGSIIAVPVPEPNVALLLGFGLMAAIGKRWKTQK